MDNYYFDSKGSNRILRDSWKTSATDISSIVRNINGALARRRLFLLNFLLVQWMFIRAAKYRSVITGKIEWCILFPVLPLTGWFGISRFNFGWFQYDVFFQKE